MATPTWADVQDALDRWWETRTRARRPRLDHARALLAKKWSGAGAGRVRISIVNGADLLGTALRIEVETLAGNVFTNELRPTVLAADAQATLDDIDDGGQARAPAPADQQPDSARAPLPTA